MWGLVRASKVRARLQAERARADKAAWTSLALKGALQLAEDDLVEAQQEATALAINATWWRMRERELVVELADRNIEIEELRSALEVINRPSAYEPIEGPNGVVA